MKEDDDNDANNSEHSQDQPQYNMNDDGNDDVVPRKKRRLVAGDMDLALLMTHIRIIPVNCFMLKRRNIVESFIISFKNMVDAMGYYNLKLKVAIKAFGENILGDSVKVSGRYIFRPPNEVSPQVAEILRLFKLSKQC